MASSERRPLFSRAQAPRLAVQGWLASRLILVVTVLLVVVTTDITVKDAFTRWDVRHFIDLSSQGYAELTQTAFFPGLPGVMYLFSLVGLPPVITGTLLSLIAAGMAAWALYRLAGDPVRGTLAVWFWSFAPMTVFTFVPYSEAIFCAFSFWAFWYAKQNRWGWAAGLAGAACLFRISGLFLIGALALVALFDKPRPHGDEPPPPRRGWGVRLSRLIWLGIPTAVIGAYFLYLRLSFGSWTTWFEAEAAGWGRKFSWPWDALLATLRVAGITEAQTHTSVPIFRWEIACFIIGVGICVWLLVRRKLPEAGWIGVQVLALSCQVWIVSLARSVLTWFPLFLLIGSLGTGEVSKPRNHIRLLLVFIALVCELIAMQWWALRYFSGAWAG